MKDITKKVHKAIVETDWSIRMNKIIIDMPTPKLTKEVEEKVKEIFPDIPVEGNDDEYADKGMSRSDFIDKEYTQ